MGSVTVRTYADLVDALIVRRHALGWSQLELDERTGWPAGYAGKLEAWQGPQGRVASRVALPLWIEALGVEITIRPRREGPRTAKATTRLSPADMTRRLPPPQAA